MKKKRTNAKSLKKTFKKARVKASSRYRGEAKPHNSATEMTGIFSSTRNGYGFVIPDEEFREKTNGCDVFIPAHMVKDTVNKDHVKFTAHADARGGEGRYDGEITSVISRAFTAFTGVYREIKSTTDRHISVKHIVIADDRKLSFDTYVQEKYKNGAVDGDKVLCEIIKYPDTTEEKPAWGKIAKVYGSAGDRTANYQALLDELNVKTSFDEENIEYAEKAALKPITKRGRLDLRGERIFTIDGAGAKDLDDAISVEKTENGWHLGVHIADVSEYVKAGSPTDSEAYLRGTSIYFTDKVVPMLPQVLSNGVCSLNGGVDRLTLSALLEIDSRGEIVSCDVKETIINSRVRGVYSEVNDIISAYNAKDVTRSEYYDKYAAVLADGGLEAILSLYSVLSAKSRKKGSLDLDSEEAAIVLDGNGDVSEIVKIERGEGERIIEQFMLAANEGVATLMTKLNLPCVYRVHEDPSPDKVQAFKKFAYSLGLDITPLNTSAPSSADFGAVLEQAKEKGIGAPVSYILLRSMMKAKYTHVPSSHYGLCIDKYCHFTSPIRRYPDLSTHRILKAAYIRKADDAHMKALAAFAESSAAHSSEAEQDALTAERDIEDLYKVTYMKKFEGEEFDGIVSSVLPTGVFVSLENTCEGYVSMSEAFRVQYDEDAMTLTAGSRTYKLGDNIKIRVIRADITTRRVDFEEIR